MKLFNFKHIAAMLLCLAMVLGTVSCGGVDFAVKFIVDGEVYATIHTSGSEMIALPDNPEKEGYRFVGWYWDEGTWLEPFTANSLLDAPLASSMNVYARFKALGTSEEDETTNNGGTNDNTNNGGGSNGGNGTQQPTVVGEAPMVGQAYLMVMEHGKLNKTYYMTGAFDGYYLATTEDMTAAPNFYFEAAGSDGEHDLFHLYAIVKGVKTYINLYKNGNYTNFKLESAPDATVYYFDATIGELVVVCEGELMALGTSNTQTYTNVAARPYATVAESFIVKYVKSTQADQGADEVTPPTVYNTPAEIMAAAEALGENEYLANKYEFTLSGEIVEIISPWTAEYENIRVLITVDGTDGRTIECFRLSGEGTESLKLGDKITVVGPIKRYVNVDENGTVTADKIEFDYPILVSVVPGEDDDVVIYETPAEIMAAAKLLSPGAYLSDGYAYTLSGKIQSVDVEYNASYNQISVTILVDGTTDTIQAFRMTGDASVLPTLAIGDQITVKGPILMYENTSTGVLKLELEKPTLESYTKGEGSGVSTPEIEALTPVVGTPYLFTLRQINAGKIMYFNGVMDSYYLGTTENKSEAVNVYIEETTGGYSLYCIKDGAKLYINLVLNGTHVNPAIESSAVTVYTYDATLGTLTASFNDATWLFGTSPSGTYLNAAARDASLENLVMQFTASDKVDPAPAEPQEITVAEFCEIALAQPNRGAATAEKYIIKGVITDIENIIYGNMTVEDETGTIFVYGVYDADGTNLFEDMTVKPKVGDTVVLLGVAGNYDRAQMQNGWIQEIIPGEGGEDDNIIYETPEEIVNAAYELAANLYLSKGVEYTLTGEIISIDTAYNASYGNITVTIVVGGMTDQPIMCYRLSGAGVEGLQVGDVITVTGPIKNYVRTDAATGAVTLQTVEFDQPVLVSDTTL